MSFAVTLRTLTAQIWLLWLLLGASLAYAADPRPYLWVIENGSTPSYLFGTIHSGHPELNRLHASVQQAFKHSDRYYGELELDAATIISTAKLLQLPSGQRLTQVLSKQRQQRINRLLAQTEPGLTLLSFEQLKPWALAITLSLLEDQLRYGANPAMDQQLYQQAKKTGKTTGALETPQQQTRVFDSLSWNEQMIMLDAILETMEQSITQGKSWMDETYAAYRSGDPDQLTVLLDQQLAVSTPLQHKVERLLITERNRYMSEQVVRQLKQHPNQQLFFAVGAAHFGSRKGIQQLLRQRGYSISRATQ